MSILAPNGDNSNKTDTTASLKSDKGQELSLNSAWGHDRNEDEATSPDGGVAPLDLIQEHLPNTYRPASRGYGEPVPGWFVPNNVKHDLSKPLFTAKVQPFAAGGFEVVIRPLDVESLLRAMDEPKPSRSLDDGLKTGESDPETRQKSVERTRRRVRYLIKSIGCDRLVTLTKRETSDFWDLEQWGKAWQEFQRLVKKAGYRFEYVAVPEKHKKGNYHLHIAMSGYLPVNIIRSIWWSCCGGRGQGNVDIAMRTDLVPSRRRSGLARYVSKYITKQVDHVEFGKKRYWSSKHALPSAGHYILASYTYDDALNEVIASFGLDVYRTRESLYRFPSLDGCWIDVSDLTFIPPICSQLR